MVNRRLPGKQYIAIISKMPRLCITSILNLFILVLLPSSAGTVQANAPISLLSPEDLKVIAPAIEAAENSITNIKIQAHSRLETKTDFYDPCEFWQKTPISHSKTAWAQKGFHQKRRVDMHREVFEWIHGPAPHGEQTYSVSFDGQHGRYVRHAVGPLGQTHLVRKGKILPEAPKSLEHGNFDTGAYYSLPFFDAEIYKFSELFQLASDPNSEVAAELEFTLEEFEGAECIKIRSRLYDVTYWLDPSHGFALRGYKSITKYQDAREELVKLAKVTKLKEIAPGIWWPMEVITVARPYEPGKPWRRFVYCASNVVANDPNFDDSIFTVPFPDGYLIDDQVAGRKYRVGEDPNAPKEQSKK